MQIALSALIRLVAASCVLGAFASANAASPSPEDRYIAARDAAIAKISKLYDDGKSDDAARAEKEASSALLAQIKAVVTEPDHKGFGPAQLNLDAFSKGDQGFGMLDGLRFDALTGENGAKAGPHGADGQYVQPRAHIIVTSQPIFERWLREHKDWWGKKLKNVPQQMEAALKDESFYTQAISTDAAVVKFSELPIAKPASATLAVAMLAGRTQDDAPNAADEVFVSALANGKLYIVYGSIKPKVQVPACLAIKTDFNKKAERSNAKAESLRQQGDDAYKRCFAQRAPQLPSFAEATQQAQALLAEAMGK